MQELRIELADAKLKTMIMQEEFRSYKHSFNLSNSREQHLILIEQNFEIFSKNQQTLFEKIAEEVKIKLDAPQDLLDLCQRINSAIGWISNIQERSSY